MLNSRIRETIIYDIDPDIVFVNETHLLKEDIIVLENFEWYGHNRKLKHINAKRGSGGVGFFCETFCFE